MQRKSSEAPEVVPQVTEKYSGEPFSYLYRFSRKQGSYHQKDVVQTPDVDKRSPALSVDQIPAGEVPQHTTPAPPPAVPAGSPSAFAYHDSFAPYEAQLVADKHEQELAFEVSAEKGRFISMTLSGRPLDISQNRQSLVLPSQPDLSQHLLDLGGIAKSQRARTKLFQSSSLSSRKQFRNPMKYL